VWTNSQIITQWSVLFAWAVILNGCVNPREAQVGIVEDLIPPDVNQSVKNVAPDFIFRSETGQRAKFSESRGDITILVFPSSEDWPHCRQCARLQKLAHQLRRVHSDVTVVSIFVPKNTCQPQCNQLRNCEIKGYADLIILCDARGNVCDLYGPHVKGKFFIIDADHHQVGTGNLTDHNAIENYVHQAVHEHEAYCNRLYGPQEIDWQN